ncbi:MAG TPA: MazG family protein [Microbacteriaceae bacterium]|nr:MazG family protein [Microbacteriaceae bacterium]
MRGLVELMATLRGPGGCPWDQAQTHESLVRYLLEESHELVEAIEAGGPDDLLEELGDVLYQVLFHADIAAHTAGEAFDLDDVADHMIAKMVGRHPHVFGDRRAADAAAVTGFWEELKRAEKPERTSVLDGIPRSLPSLLLADKMLGRAASVGAGPRRGPGRPAPSAAATSLAAADVPVDEGRLGDLLLTIVADARAAGLDAERALRTRLRALADEVVRAEGAAVPGSSAARGPRGAEGAAGEMGE